MKTVAIYMLTDPPNFYAAFSGPAMPWQITGYEWDQWEVVAVAILNEDAELVMENQSVRLKYGGRTYDAHEVLEGIDRAKSAATVIRIEGLEVTG